MSPASNRRGPTRVALALVAPLSSLALIASCGSQGDINPNLQSLDRPTDVAFACFGPLRITNGDAATVSQPIQFTTQPLESCRIRSQGHVDISPPPHQPPIFEDIPPGQQSLPLQAEIDSGHRWYAFVLQSVPGTVAVAEADVKQKGATADEAGESYMPGDITVQDATPLSPGKNSLSVGRLPIAIATDNGGCHMVTANAGSCDLSIIDANRAISRSTEPAVRRQPVSTPTGVPVRARPAAMIAEEQTPTLGLECPAEPTGLFYIAYPDCHAVAAVRAVDGKVLASIRFDASGVATIADGELQCAAECDGEAVTAGARPVTLDVARDRQFGTIRLAIGLDNRPTVTVVDLDDGWQPLAIEQVTLSGEVGVLDVAISPLIGVGGRNGADTGDVDLAQFVYAVATDGSVRVVEVSKNDSECDTQVDPRFLLETADPARLTCLPVGSASTPPRRANAEGPGIRVPGDAVPVSVVIARSGLDRLRQDVAPNKLIGTFAFIGLSSGIVAVANVDDDNYDDLQLTALDPFATQLPLAMPHQLRDSFINRVARTVTGTGAATMPLCKSNGLPDNVGGPRAKTAPTQIIRTANVATDKSLALPFLRQVDCNGQDGRAPVPEVSMNAPVPVRLETFPDWRAAEFAESWTLTWEGALSADSVNTAIDGPPIRAGYVEVAGGGIKIHDAARPFCAIGVEDRDQVVLRGCDPTRGDGQCGPGQVCYVHPDSTQAAGACLPKDDLTDLVGPCRDFLISSRRFAVKRAFAGDLELIERRRALRTSPITGCVSNDQCQTLATYEDSLRSDAHPIDDDTAPSTRTFSCELDPSRPLVGGQDLRRCMQTCSSSTECSAGGKCSGNRCIEAPVPPPACVVGLQRYELQASDAFVVLGSLTGYLHSMVADPTTGRCMKDPAASPLLAGRIPLTAPACSGSGVPDVVPNPCTITVEQADELPRYNPGSCTLGSPENEIAVRQTTAVRFRNPVMTLNLVDPTYPGDARCTGDRGGALVGVPITYPGYQIQFAQIAGFSTAAVASVRASYLSKLVLGPDRGIWVVDEGDVASNVLNARGAVFRFNHDPFGSGVVFR